jgi:hypothetical protein
VTEGSCDGAELGCLEGVALSATDGDELGASDEIGIPKSIEKQSHNPEVPLGPNKSMAQLTSNDAIKALLAVKQTSSVTLVPPASDDWHKISAVEPKKNWTSATTAPLPISAQLSPSRLSKPVY